MTPCQPRDSRVRRDWLKSLRQFDWNVFISGPQRQADHWAGQVPESVAACHNGDRAIPGDCHSVVLSGPSSGPFSWQNEADFAPEYLQSLAKGPAST